MASAIDTPFDVANQPSAAAEALQRITTVPTTKLTSPALPSRLLARAPLLQFLAQTPARRLITISAAAGYGKSTLAALWLKETADPAIPFASAWLALEADDNDPLRFLTCLAAALAHIIPTAAAVATNVALHQSPRQAMRLLLDGLAGAAQPIRLVIDDLHRIHDPAVLDLLAAALERIPPNLQWMLLSRHTLPFSLGKLRLQDEVLELESTDLLLQSSEIEELLALNDILNWDRRDVEMLVERTHGWITGIQLALLSLRRQAQGKGDDQQHGTLRDLLRHIRGDNFLLAEYLTGELLAQQSEEMRSFLLQCSVVDRLCAGLCDAIRGQEDSEGLLQQAFDERLMLQPLDAHGEWYALHHLFRELLLRTLRKRYAASEVRTLHRRAAAWLLRQGDMPGALTTLLAGGHPELAAELVQSRSRPALLLGNHVELRQWANLLPAQQVDARPQLLLDLAWTYATTEQNTFAAMLARARSSLATAAAPQQEWLDEMTALTLLARSMSTDQTGLYRDCLAALDQLDADSHLARGWIHMTAVLVADYQSPEAPAATHLQVAAGAFARAGYTPGEITMLAMQAHWNMSHGAAAAALADCTHALQLLERLPHPGSDTGAFFSFLAGETLYWQNRVEEAAACFRQARTYAQQYGEDWYLLLTNAALLLCALASGRPASALDVLKDEEERLWQPLAEAQPVGTKGQLAQWQMMCWLALGNKEQAWRAFVRMGVSLNSLATDAAENAWLALLTAYVGCGRELASLAPLLQAHLRRAGDVGSLHVAIRIQLLIASSQQQLGNAGAAHTALRAALHDCERTGYVRMVLNHPELAPALRVVNTAYARRVLAQLRAAPPPAPRSALTEQQAAILALLGEARSNEEIAERLVLSVSTVKWHLNNIYKTLGVKNRREAIAHIRSRPVL